MNSLLNLTSQDLVNLNADVAASFRGRNRAERAGRCERSIMHDCLGSFTCAAVKPIADEWPMGDADRNMHAASQPTRSGKHQEWNSKLIESSIVAKCLPSRKSARLGRNGFRFVDSFFGNDITSSKKNV